MFRTALSLWKLTFRAAPRESLLGLLTSPIGMAAPILITYLINLLTNAAVARNLTLVTRTAVIFALVVALMYYLQGLTTRMRLTLTEKARLALQAEVMEKVASVRTLELHEANEASDRLELLRQGQEEIANGPSEVIVTLGYLTQLGLTVGLLGSVHPLLLLLPVLGLAPTVMMIASERILRESEVTSAPSLRLARQTLLAGTSVNGASETLLFNAANHLEKVYSKAMESAGRILDATRFRVTSLQLLGWLVFAVGFVAATILTIDLALRGQVTEGQVVMVVLLAATVSGHMSNISFSARNLGSLLRKVSHFHWLEDFASKATRDRGDKQPPSELGDSVSFENVWFKYPGTSRWVLRNLSFTLPAGSLTAIAGRNGSGKTTITKLLLGLYSPDEGRILVDGVDLKDIDLEAWHKRCTAVFQDLPRFELKLGESVAISDLARLDSRQDQIAALERAGAGHLSRDPGIDAQLGRRWGGVNLSGGQWQKIALARAQYRNDTLVNIFDEATASLDPSSERNIFVDYANSWRKMNQVRGVAVFITHRFPSINFADKIIVIEDGTVAEHGTHDELLEAKGIYSELYRVQLEMFDLAKSSR